MLVQSKNIAILFVVLVLALKINAHSSVKTAVVFQVDSLIEEKKTDRALGSLDLLVLYQEAIKEKRDDSIVVFKNLSLLNAKLKQPKDAKIYAEKYIKSTLDISLISDSAFNPIKGTQEYHDLEDKYLPKVSVLSFFYFCAALIGLFLVLVINLSKSGSKKTKVFISIFISAHSFFILEFVLYMTKLGLNYPHSYRFSSSMALLFGPSLYFYIKHVLQDYKFRTISLLHLLPTIILLLFLLPIYVLSSEEKLRIMLEIVSAEGNDFFIFLVKSISLVLYAVLIGKMLFSKIKVLHLDSDKKPIKKWAFTLYLIHILYVVTYLIYGVFAFLVSENISSNLYYILIGIMSTMVLYIGYMAFVQPSIFGNTGLTLASAFNQKYEKSGLTNAFSEELKEQLIKLLTEEEIYKKSGISLALLSEKLNTTKHNTSQIINEHFEMNFFELINKFRIKEAIRILESDIHGNFNIIDVAYEVGFNNKVTFNKAFKKETSLTPTEYIQNRFNSNLKVKRK